MRLVRRKVPYVEELQQTECGLCCIAMILRYYKSYETLQELRECLDVGRDGSSLRQLSGLLKVLNFDTKVYKAKLEGLYNLDSPIIVYWEDKHFVILEKITDKHAYIVDPSTGRVKITIADFKESYADFIIYAKPNEDFKPKAKAESVWKSFSKVIFEKKALFLKILIMSIITYLFTLAIPIFIKNLIDKVNGNDYAFVNKAFYWVFGVSILYSVFYFIRNNDLINLRIYLDRFLANKLFTQILKVPYKFFDLRNKGDILYSLNSSVNIRELFANQMIRGLIDCGATIFIVYYMASQSIIMMLISLGLFILNIAVIMGSRLNIIEYNKYLLLQQSKYQAVQIETVYSILGIKMAAMEEDAFASWDKQYESYLKKYRYKEKLINRITVITHFISTISPLIILSIGVYLLTLRTLTIGQVIALYSLSNTFFSLASSLTNTWYSFIESTAYLERIFDIISFDTEEITDNHINLELKGSIKLDNVDFSYSKHSKKVLENISLEIKAGEKVAIVGKSGSGKSTLAKIIVGLYEGTSGEVYYDDINVNNINRKFTRNQMGIVPQEVYLFNKSIYANISMDRSCIEMEDVIEAAKIAQIHDEIEAMPMKYSTLVAEMGLNLSGGQRQRIALARAIIDKPKIIVLDEATSSLDNINEKQVSDYFKELGCTRIILAHRLSTIMDADSIIVLNEGKIIEKGCHEELIARKGMYYSLYNNDTNSNVQQIKIEA